MLVDGKNNTKVLVKDEKTINQRGKETYIKNCEKVYEYIIDAEKNNNYEEFFLDKSFITEKEHIPNREMCGMKEKDSSKLTEKRICRCMFYYNEKDKKNSDQCFKCKLNNKYKNISKDYIITDAEKPTKKVINSCGGIDLILKDKKGKEYAVEVKPPKSQETLVRMVAEIYTYTIEYPQYIKSIAFFAGSQQEKDTTHIKIMNLLKNY